MKPLKLSQGFAFLEYENPEAAFLCLLQMNGVCIQGYNIKVCKVSRCSALFLGLFKEGTDRWLFGEGGV